MRFIYRFAIGLYQKHLSPRKGYRCAYSLEHGGTGCSGAVLKILEENGLWHGWSLIKQRFEDCGDAAEKRKKRKKDKNNGGGSTNDCFPSVACDGAEGLCQCAPKLKKCDLPDLPDCGGCDCGGLSISRFKMGVKEDCDACKNCGFANIFSRRK